jgi:hypothetical protein
MKGHYVKAMVRAGVIAAFALLLASPLRATGKDAAANSDKVLRQPFQARLSVSPTSTGNQTASLAIPEGKRLVIENISAVARTPEGFKMELNFYTYLDNDGDGVGGIEDIVFHRIALVDQGTFDGIAIASANHKVLVFGDSRIGDTSYGVTFQARLNGTIASNAFAQGQLTVSGYLDDLTVR